MTDKGRQLQPCPRQAFILRTADGGGLSCLFSRTHAKRNVEIPFQFSIEGKDIVFFAKKKKKRKGQETTKVFAARASSRLRFPAARLRQQIVVMFIRLELLEGGRRNCALSSQTAITFATNFYYELERARGGWPSVRYVLTIAPPPLAMLHALPAQLGRVTRYNNPRRLTPT